MAALSPLLDPRCRALARWVAASGSYRVATRRKPVTRRTMRSMAWRPRCGGRLGRIFQRRLASGGLCGAAPPASIASPKRSASKARSTLAPAPAGRPRSARRRRAGDGMRSACRHGLPPRGSRALAPQSTPRSVARACPWGLRPAFGRPARGPARRLAGGRIRPRPGGRTAIVRESLNDPRTAPLIVQRTEGLPTVCREPHPQRASSKGRFER